MAEKKKRKPGVKEAGTLAALSKAQKAEFLKMEQKLYEAEKAKRGAYGPPAKGTKPTSRAKARKNMLDSMRKSREAAQKYGTDSPEYDAARKRRQKAFVDYKRKDIEAETKPKKKAPKKSNEIEVNTCWVDLEELPNLSKKDTNSLIGLLGELMNFGIQVTGVDLVDRKAA